MSGRGDEPGPTNQRDLDRFTDLVRTDAEYFEAGAELLPVAAATVVLLPGFADIAAGCLTIRVDATAAERDPQRVIAESEAMIRRHGGRLYRTYLTDHAPALATALRASGYRGRAESVMCCGPATESSGPIRLREIRSAAGWGDKVELDSRAGALPDGHDCSPEHWAEFERVKWTTGAVQYFVAEYENEPCGTVGLMQSGRVYRMKNLVIAPEFRRRGLATLIARAFRELAVGLDVVCGAFALANGPAERAYRKAGFVPVGSVLEFTKEMNDDARVR